MELYCDLKFEAAHWLPHVPEGHKCRRPHGHSYRLRVCVRGPIREPEGWVMDFADLKRVINPLVDSLDHQMLNELPGLENPTAENIARWFWRRLRPAVPGLHKLILRETRSSGCVYRGEDE